MAPLLVTDQNCRAAVEAAASAMGLSPTIVSTPGSTLSEIDDWLEAVINDATKPPLTHLIAIERVGPSHTRTSISQQPSATADDLQRFEHLVSPADHDHCFNMRGICIDGHTAPLHRLFELANRTQKIRTIGIGDGGNEIGMGSIPWQELQLRLGNPDVAKIPCRIATDRTIIAGVSNWGAMALAAATLLLRDQQANLQHWTARQQQDALAQLVEHGPAVDGITRLPEATVDGLPFLTYIQPWEGIRRVIGLID
jgi:hypothetical protein